MKIGKRAGAKKYAKLREKQATANKMLYKSTHIEKSHGKRLAVVKMKQQFFKSRGIKNPSMLSFKNLSTADLKAYEKLLDSIINNTYVNPEKYEKMIDKQRQQFEQSDFANDMDFADYTNFWSSDITNILMELGVDYKELLNTLNDFTNNGLNMDDFISMSTQFLKDNANGSYTLDDFFVYADDYIDKWG